VDHLCVDAPFSDRSPFPASVRRPVDRLTAAAMTLIRDGESVVLDGGTTGPALRLLPILALAIAVTTRFDSAFDGTPQT
jgi:predicted kinase